MNTSDVRVGNIRRGRRGFSLVELLVSIGIVATVLVYIIGVFTTGMKANRKSVDLTAGTLVAESVISHELYGVLADKDKSARFFAHTYTSNDAAIEGTETLSNTVFTYKLFVSDVNQFVESGNKMKKVDVQVWWWVPESTDTSDLQGNTIRAGYGVVSVGMTRLINQQSKF